MISSNHINKHLLNYNFLNYIAFFMYWTLNDNTKDFECLKISGSGKQIMKKDHNISIFMNKIEGLHTFVD